MQPVPEPVPERLEVLAAFGTEVEAATVVAALREAGIEAVATGGAVSQFQVAVPAWVQILVSDQDLPVARNTLARLREELSHLDWSQVDVGEPEDDSPADVDDVVDGRTDVGD